MFVSLNQFVVKRLLEKCGEYVTTKQSSNLTQWHPVLGWFSRPLDHHLNEPMALVKSQLQLLWSGVVLKVMFSALTSMIAEQVSYVKVFAYNCLLESYYCSSIIIV